ncbi:hypothetical protein HU200_040311 [Digitaria exilis]|uniref:Uncharacterized protein n=1 Tax=Digitaria exilis TaxID=1010633 RepID=A0A835EJW4_9POAL|nr:hypothetical protein HU200_040311 [Digitaria exilis]
MAEGGVVPCRLGGAGAAPAPGRQCCGGGGCGLGLARLVRRLRRRGRRALRGAAGAAASSQQRRRACRYEYDPLSYARNFDLGGDGDARVCHGCSFSSRFVLVPAASATATSSASSAGAGAIDASAGGAAPAAVVTS